MGCLLYIRYVSHSRTLCKSATVSTIVRRNSSRLPDHEAIYVCRLDTWGYSLVLSKSVTDGRMDAALATDFRLNHSLLFLINRTARRTLATLLGLVGA